MIVIFTIILVSSPNLVLANYISDPVALQTYQSNRFQGYHGQGKAI